MKKITAMLLLCAAMSVTLLTGCDENDSTAKETQSQEQMSNQAINSIGLPGIANWTTKKTLKAILERCDQTHLVMYAYTQSEMSGKFIFIGKCIGYPIPYSTQYTNPMKIERSSSAGYGIIPQADPDGVYRPASADGTWVQLMDDEGNVNVVYIEPKITVSPFPLKYGVEGFNGEGK